MTSPVSRSGPSNINASLQETNPIQAILDDHFKVVPNGKPVGCNAVIMREGQAPQLLKGGNIELNGKDAAQHWASVSKQFTAASILELEKKRLLSWDQDIRELSPDLPEFKLDGVPQKITVDDLLHMRSGLPEVYHYPLLIGKDSERTNNAEFLKLLRQHPGMVRKPGAAEIYCNTNYILLAKIVEDVAKKNGLMAEEETFADFVREQIFIPRGMEARCSSDPGALHSIDGYNEHYEACTTPCPELGPGGIIGRPSDMIPWNNAFQSDLAS